MKTLPMGAEVSRYTIARNIRRAEKKLRDATLSKDLTDYASAMEALDYWTRRSSQI